MFDNLLYTGIFFIVLSFISGSVPYGLLYSALRGVDIRKVGSGNIGATNVTRQFGFWQGFVPVLIMDMAKGILPLVFFFLYAPKGDAMLFDTLEILIGVAAIMGHVFSPFLNFKGGKGIATTGGVLFVWNPMVAAMTLGSFIIIFLTFGKKIVGRASVVAALILPFLAFLVPGSTLPFKVIAVILAVLIVLTHKSNIKDWQTGEDLIKKQQRQKEKEQLKNQ